MFAYSVASGLENVGLEELSQVPWATSLHMIGPGGSCGMARSSVPSPGSPILRPLTSAIPPTSQVFLTIPISLGPFPRLSTSIFFGFRRQICRWSPASTVFRARLLSRPLSSWHRLHSPSDHLAIRVAPATDALWADHILCWLI